MEFEIHKGLWHPGTFWLECACSNSLQGNFSTTEFSFYSKVGRLELSKFVITSAKRNAEDQNKKLKRKNFKIPSQMWVGRVICTFFFISIWSFNSLILFCFLYSVIDSFLYPHQRSFLHWFSEREEGREKGGKRDTSMQKRNIYQFASCTHTCIEDRTLNLWPRYAPWPGTEPATFWLWGNTPTKLSHTSQGTVLFILHIYLQQLESHFWKTI